MRKNFVTLFNSSYLSRGITLYRSLLSSTANFHLYIIAFDDFTFKYLSEANLPNMTVVSLRDFEDPELIRIKSTRSATEYCWTCTPSTISYCIHTFQLDHCIYLDADMFFYADPQPLYDEWGGRSVLITSHRFSAEHDQGALNGKYCVQYVGFKNDGDGMAALKWWRDACIEWCYDRMEDGKFGDQKYLDDWTVRFKNVCDLEYPGGGVAPWNVQRYELERINGKWQGREISNGRKFDLIFFHFHSLKFYTDHTVALASGYNLDGKGVRTLYFDYVSALMRTGSELQIKLPGTNVHGARTVAPFKPLRQMDELKNRLKLLLGRGRSFSREERNLYYIEDIVKA
jgi:hypothetical protein